LYAELTAYSPQGISFLNEKMVNVLLEWFSDKVYQVRQAAIVAAKELAKVIGVAWVQKNLLDRILAFQQNSNYLLRINALIFIQVPRVAYMLIRTRRQSRSFRTRSPSPS